LTQRWNLYPKVNGKPLKNNLQNYHPLFPADRLSLTARVMHLVDALLETTQILDIKALYLEIKEVTLALLELADLRTPKEYQKDDHWAVNTDGLLCWEECIFVPDKQEL